MSITTVGSVGAGRPDIAPRNVELGLLLAAEHARVEAVVLAHPRGELSSVGGVAHGRGEHGDVRLAAVGLDRLAVLRQSAKDPLGGLLGERAAGVYALAQPGHLRAPEQLPERTAARVDVRDQQPGGVGSDVHDGDAHGRDARRVWSKGRTGGRR